MMVFNSKKVSYFLLLNTIINPYYHSCGFVTDIYLTISPVPTSATSIYQYCKHPLLLKFNDTNSHCLTVPVTFS